MTLVPHLLRWLAERGIACRLDEETAAYAGRAADCRASMCRTGAS